MKILKEGNWNNPWKSNLDCKEPQCKAELEVLESDLQQDGYRYSQDFNPYFVCPVCGHNNVVTNLPKRVYVLLDNKRLIDPD